MKTGPLPGDQSFELRGIPAGRYNLLANANIDGEDYSSRVEVYVGDGDTETPDLVLRPAVEVRGTVTVEGDLPGIRVLPGDFRGVESDGRPRGAIITSRMFALMEEACLTQGFA